MNKSLIIIPLSCLIAIFLVFSVSAITYSNESQVAKMLIDNATQDIHLMEEKNIPTSRANEALQQAIQLYKAQLALENQKKEADYKLVTSYAEEVFQIKSISFKAQDELNVFLESYNSAKDDFNLSEMDPEYNAIIKSFSDERFEDTPDLIDKGYQKLSDLQASQTTLKLFYDTTSRSIKQFAIDNAKSFISPKFYQSLYFWIIVIIIVLIISWKTIKRIRIKAKIRNLLIRKDSIYDLIRKLQSEYFKSKKISETEYFSKMEKFKDMVREIDRKIPLLKEDLIRVDKEKLRLSMNSTYRERGRKHK